MAVSAALAVVEPNGTLVAFGRMDDVQYGSIAVAQAKARTAALFRTGNSGSIYFVVDGVTYGPVAPGAQVAKDIQLSPEALTQSFAQADLTSDEDLARFATADASDVVSAPATEASE